MKLKYLSKEFTFDLNELADQTLGSLKDKIREVIKECSGISDDKILLFYNKVKLPGDKDLKLSDEKININNESTVFIVVIAGGVSKPEEKKTKPATNTSSIPQQPPMSAQQSPMPGYPPMFGYPQPGYDMEKQVMDHIINNPDSMMQMLEAQMPNMPDEQRAIMKQSIEMIKQNPDLVRQMMSNNPMIMNALRNPGAMGGYNPYMMGSPNMMGAPNGMMGTPNPMMGSPNMMGTPNAMMGGYNPYMQNMMMGGYNPYMMQPTPPNGPCSHGFYPPKITKGGVAEPQDARELWKDSLSLMKEMGFYDEEENLSALMKHGGNLSDAVEYLTSKRNHEHSK